MVSHNRTSPEIEAAIIADMQKGLGRIKLQKKYGIGSSALVRIRAMAVAQRAPDKFALLPDRHIGKVTTQVGHDGTIERHWIRHHNQFADAEAYIRDIASALKEEMPRAEPVRLAPSVVDDLLTQYLLTDFHLGMLAWGEETRQADWDTSIAEKMLYGWFDAATMLAPPSARAALVFLGDNLHYDGMKAVTPTSKHVLDADTRFPKIVRIFVKFSRWSVPRLLEKHGSVEIVVCGGNHDPASSIWLREFLATFFENEPRVIVHSSPSNFQAIEHGQTSIYYHHGDRRNVRNVDVTLAGQFRALYGRTRHAYAHIGHLHSKAVMKGDLMDVEQHRTLAPGDSYSAGGGWSSVRGAQIITYSRRFGETGRLTVNPEMLEA